MQNIYVVKCLLRCFELVAGLKVNFSKTKLAGKCVEGNLINSLASLLHCSLMEIPFTYLGLPVGGNPRRLLFWKPVIDRLSSKLTKWKQKALTFGGRLCLINSVLSSIPLYFLSFFKMPAGVIAKCNTIMRKFLWGGPDCENKIAWVSWRKLCKPKNEGGLGIKDMKLFNLALLGKWRWRMLTEKHSLWCRILSEKYHDSVSQKDSIWWKDLCSVCFDA